MTLEEWLKEAESRCSGATAGAWAANLLSDDLGDPRVESRDEHGTVNGGWAICTCHGDESGDDIRNAAFIAAARSDLPLALRIVRLALAWRHSTEATCDAAGEALVVALDEEVASDD